MKQKLETKFFGWTGNGQSKVLTEGYKITVPSGREIEVWKNGYGDVSFKVVSGDAYSEKRNPCVYCDECESGTITWDISDEDKAAMEQVWGKPPLLFVRNYDDNPAYFA